MQLSRLAYVVALLVFLKGCIGVKIRNGTYKFCQKRFYAPTTVCLTSGSRVGDSIEYKVKTSKDDQIWVINEYGYLVNRASGLGIDIGDDYKCAEVTVNIRDHEIISNSNGVFAVNLRMAEFNPSKTSMRWKPSSSKNRVVNIDMLLSIHDALADGPFNGPSSTSPHYHYSTVAVFGYYVNVPRIYTAKDSQLEQCFKKINNFIYNHKRVNAHTFCYSKAGEEFCLAVEDGSVLFKNIKSSLVHLWETNVDGFIVNSQSKLGLDLSESICVEKGKHLFSLCSENSTGEIKAFPPKLAPFSLANIHMRWKPDETGTYLKNDDIRMVMELAIDDSLSNKSIYYKAIAVNVYNISKIHRSSRKFP